LSHFIHKNDHVTKTSSGQTKEKLRGKVFSAGIEDYAISQTSLEQIFNKFAAVGQQEEEEERTRQGGEASEENGGDEEQGGEAEGESGGARVIGSQP
jgi:hypothetical protein